MRLLAKRAISCAVVCALVALRPAYPALAMTAQNPELRIGRAGHAFDHLGSINGQAEAAAASGATIIYATGVGADGYSGLPSFDELAEKKRASIEYLRNARQKGIRLAIGYLCATSIVKLNTFDQNWTPDFRARFHTPPAQWLQQDRNGKPLPSWYGGDYNPACMNNSDWRKYERFMVRQQIEAGHDGIFFDNPTVHPQGCYCPHCMRGFGVFIKTKEKDIASLRRLAGARKDDFLRFRSMIARDFLQEMRQYARSLKRDALITCNNSLNSPAVFYSQCRNYGYNIQELSKVEDFVTLEDMSTQPRTLANGKTVEYGPMYEMVRAISHGKPIVAVTIAEGDYHTPPNLMRLAMAEAAAHGASYLSWPTWPEEQRDRMIRAVRPESDFLRANEALLNNTKPRREVLLFLPYREWIAKDHCAMLDLAGALIRANYYFELLSEDEFTLKRLRPPGPRQAPLVIESRKQLTDEERRILSELEQSGGEIIEMDQVTDPLQALRMRGTPDVIVLHGAERVRAVAWDQGKRTILHLINLNLKRLSSYEDEVVPATDLLISCRVPAGQGKSVRVLTADATGTRGVIPFTVLPRDDGSIVEFTLPHLDISAIVVIE